jgi:hypothetical protein
LTIATGNRRLGYDEAVFAVPRAFSEFWSKPQACAVLNAVAVPDLDCAEPVL